MSRQLLPEDDRAALNARISAESARFRARLPELLPIYQGKWVVFREGDVVSAHSSFDDAYLDALDRFGQYGGFVVAEVKEAEVVVMGGFAGMDD